MSITRRDRIRRQADSIMGKHAKNARLGGNHKYTIGASQSRKLAASVIKGRRKYARSK
jgi:hypothetical protein